ncbi:hypothetical protein WME79_01455 [Sorangium sp. So ce726]
MKRQHLPGAQLVQPAASGAFEDLGALVLRDHPLHLREQSILGALAQRVLHKVHSDAMSVQLLDQYVLVDVVACKPVGAVHQHPIDQPIRGRITKGVETRPIEARTADPLIEVASLGGHRHPHRGRCMLQGRDL